ncbi:MAG TPA: EAL domain-containing protein [Terriglobales bacterium]|nr:EAL domain-containing protein [Terriglobales bacterium]
MGQSRQSPRSEPAVVPIEVRRIDGREWWLWGFAITVTLVLTFGIVALTFPTFRLERDSAYWLDLREWVRGLAALVLLFDLYTIYQHLQLQRIRRQLAERDQLFQLISENAADMIAVVDTEGQRLYNSPAYEKVLGYSPEELKATSSIEQIHADDRPRVLEAAEKARRTGRGERLEYRIRHKDGSWRVLESTASTIRNAKGEITRLVIVNRDITERKRAEDMLAHSALHDGLTGLPNRALFLDRLQHAFARAERNASFGKLAVLFFDVDEFKVYNDSLGHAAGDELLIQIGQRLTASLRGFDTISRQAAARDAEASPASDTLARLGGDEFAVLLDDILDPSDAIRVAERIQEKLRTAFQVKGQEIVISASIGIALRTSALTRAEDLLRDAEIAMYRGKRAGKARCEVFDAAMHSSAVHRLQLETDLRKAVELGEFRVHYQPVVSLRTGRITGFEALSRWQRPEGLVPPGEFIRVLDETGLILPVNRALLRESCELLRTWHAQFSLEPPLSMSVNITPKQFAQPELASEIGLILEQTGLAPSSLQLEIIETIAMGDAEGAGGVLAELKALGVRLSIDDFGTGYSSLGRLRRLPFDSLKIDRGFISHMDEDVESREIVRTIIALAHNLDLTVVAEGVETESQMQQLQQLGCEMAQGYFFSRPADAETMAGLLAQCYRRDVVVKGG